MLRVISLGAGVQSTTMAEMAARGEIGPMPDAAIFSDTHHEPQAVYEHLERLMEPGHFPFPVYRVSRGDLWESATRVRTTRDGERKYIGTAIPVYTKDGLRRGHGQRHCTRDYKIHPVNQKVREMLGIKRVTKAMGVVAEVWIGISADEEMRKKPNAKPYLKSRWPLLEQGMTRTDCLAWMADHGLPEPPRSACTFCPFHDDNEWLALSSAEFSDAVGKERELQGAYAETAAFDGVPYLHEKRVPLGTIDMELTPIVKKPIQLRMFNNECEGMCGV